MMHVMRLAEQIIGMVPTDFVTVIFILNYNSMKIVYSKES